MPPVELPIATPTRAGVASGSSSPLCASASSSASNAKRSEREARTRAERGMRRGSGTSRTSPAMCTLRPSVSTMVTGPMQVRSPCSASRSDAVPGPAALIVPRPVTTTRVRPSSIEFAIAQCIVRPPSTTSVVPVT
jgi:hypothetical protein